MRAWRRIGCAVGVWWCLVMGFTAVWAQEAITLYPLEDAWINEANPALNYGNSTYLSIKDSSGFADAMLKFSGTDLAQLAGKTITSATLYAYQYMGTYTPGDDLSLYKVLSGWSEGGVTWNSPPMLSGKQESSISLSSGVNMWRRWDGLEGLVSEWIKDPSTNFGVALSNSLDGKKDELFTRFYSSEVADITKRPYIEVNTGVAPEPISSTLFILGACSLGMKRIRKLNN